MQNLPICPRLRCRNFLQIPLLEIAEHTVAEDAKSSDLSLASCGRNFSQIPLLEIAEHTVAEDAKFSDLSWLRCRNFSQIPLLEIAEHSVAEDAKSSDLPLASLSEFFANSATRNRRAHCSGRCKIFRSVLGFAVGIFRKFRYGRPTICPLFNLIGKGRERNGGNGIKCTATATDYQLIAANRSAKSSFALASLVF